MENCVIDIDDMQFILQVLGGKWKLHILTTLYFGKKRFKELEREITGISPKMLIKELKELEAAGIVDRQTFNTVPITVEYSLTEDGLTLKPVLEHMKTWATTFRETQQVKTMTASAL
ncbi:winged helix-turn-helix transcriptional regulator [Chitinophaga pinensis]|uniref:Transcriptional regulator, HxlR family n=1 Tax=Chitinophaga pinensis (strain ATCC 43595 / DSM 2588 / LMG 13176 / NBRC 15968 / NCIMB 11800 / UQM 2034) TaxID=485918 RepID=A0A979GBX7_CHIPD|nr:helix-turn-helix domain-containing protein [Chitinophaga pinensis]ACU64646.1 transcriptional regulator, HxlR family [Chitinophaga pinensis DSM 2588]